MKIEKLLAFSKLLNRVRFQNNWSSDSFADCAKRTDGVSSSEGLRFHKALVFLGYLVKSGRSNKPIFDTKIWNDEDYRINIIKNILEDHPIVQKRGRVKGKVYLPKETAIVVQHNPLESISSKDLVNELRNRGFDVECKRSITVVEKL